MNAAASLPYAEFAIQSNFSFLRGASQARGAGGDGQAARPIARSALPTATRVAGVVRAWQQAKVENLAYHPGCRLVFSDGTPDILAYPQDRKGWGHLCRMLTQANRARREGRAGPASSATSSNGATGCRWRSCRTSTADRPRQAGLCCGSCKDRFGDDRLACRLRRPMRGNDRFRLEQAAALADAAGLPLMAVNDVLYHMPERRQLQDVLTAIRLNIPVGEAGLRARPANAERHLKPPGEMARLFRRHPEAIAETQRFAAEPRLLA